MNLQQIFTGSAAEMDKYARFWQNQNLDFSSGANKLANGKYTLNKLKMKAGDGLLVIPVMLHLALDFSGHKLIDPVPYVGSVRTAISLVKTLAKNNANYADGLKELIGEDSFNKLNLADVGTVTDDEYAIFKRLWFISALLCLLELQIRHSVDLMQLKLQPIMRPVTLSIVRRIHLSISITALRLHASQQELRR